MKPERINPQPLEAALLPEALLDKRTVRAVTGLSVSTLYRRMAEGKFPEAVKLGTRCTRWPAATVAAWVASASATAGKAQGGKA